MDPLLVVIVGPTASGKTALSLALAERFGGEIVNCDSVAVYRELYIGTAKPSAEERARAPHHLLDIVEPTERFTAGAYARRAREVLDDIKSRGRVPIVVGGTGLYLRALLEGLFAGPERRDDLRERLKRRGQQRGAGYLHRVLSRLDPAAAEKIHANDESKLVRAIEVCLASRQRMSELWQQGREPLRGFRVVRVGLDPEREKLYERINLRSQWMFEHGLVEEVAALRAKYGDVIWPLGAVGYRQASLLLAGLDRETAISEAQKATRHYAKRQMTWFRREPDVHWLQGFGDEAKVQQQAIDYLSFKFQVSSFEQSQQLET